MNRKIQLVTFLMSIVLFATLGFTEDNSEFNTLSNQAIELYKNGQYHSAIEVAKKALEIAEQNASPDQSLLSTAINNLASIHLAQGNYANAESLFMRNLKIIEQKYGPDHLEVATCVNNLASVYLSQGEYARAEPFFKRALTIWKENL